MTTSEKKLEAKIEGETNRFEILRKMFTTISDSEQENYKKRMAANDEFKKFIETDCTSKLSFLTLS